MGKLGRWLCAGLFAAASVVGASDAGARTRAKVDFTQVEVRAGDDAARVEKRLRGYLKDAVKRADFGEAKHVEARVKVLELRWEKRGDVIRLTCTVVGRLVGGPSAKSRISFGGDPAHRDDLEKQVLTSVSTGLVARIAQMARARAEKEPPPEEAPHHHAHAQRGKHGSQKR